MGFDTAYEAIAEQDGGERWAFGTGFTDALAGVDTTVPDGVPGADLAGYCLMLGDDALVMSHRLQQWLARAPELEEETALANIALDLLGQAQLLLARAGQADGSGRTEDDFAFGRDEHEFRSVVLAELTDADFAGLIARLLVFSTWRLALLDRLRSARDPVLAAVAAKGVKEITYHRDYAAQWLLRLAGGTEYSRGRIVAGLAAVRPYLPGLFTTTDLERRLVAAGTAVDPAELRPEYDAAIGTVLDLAGLPRLESQGPPPAGPGEPVGEGEPVGQGEPAGQGQPAGQDEPAGQGQPVGPGQPDSQRAAAAGDGRAGVHTAAMAELLRELQSVARAYPGATW